MTWGLKQEFSSCRGDGTKSRIRSSYFFRTSVGSHVTDDCVPPGLPHLPLEAPHEANGSGDFMNEHVTVGIYACEVD